MSSILIIDDDRALARSLQIHLDEQGHSVRLAHTLSQGWVEFSKAPAGIVFLDLKLPDGDSRPLLGRILSEAPATVVIMISGHQDMQATIEAIQTGAFDYIRKPLDLNQILAVLAKAREQFGKQRAEAMETTLGEGAPRPREIVGRSEAIVSLLKQIAVLAESRVPVLIQGETGTGKELVARALHGAAKGGEPFVAVNCGGIVPTLLESELFGHEKGAFTGAEGRKLGKLELAADGTVFFDEVGDLPFDLQAKLLRALQEREFERVGGVTAIPLKARILAATHRDLDSRIREGRFRQDLFFRLAVARLHVAPLRDRAEDIPLLVEFLLGKIAQQVGKAPVKLSAQALKILGEYQWPGNVRELENVLTRAVALVRSEMIDAADLRFDSTDTPEVGWEAGAIIPLREMEKKYVALALKRHGWNITKTAAVLDISPTTLRKKINDYEIRDEPGR